MRSFAPGSFALAFGLAACNPDPSIGSATEGAGTSGIGITEGLTTSSTTGEPASTSTTGATPTTGEPTPTTSGEPETSTSTTGTTGEPGTTTIVETTGEDPIFPEGDPYGSCNNDMGDKVACGADSMCLDNHNIKGLDGAYCSFRCDSDPCPVPMDLPGSVQSLCAFDSNNDDDPDLCALLCNMGNDECPGGMACDDVGIPEMMNMKFGICTWPKG